MLGFTYERRFEAHPDYPQLWAIRKAIRELRRKKKGRDDNFHQKLERLKSRATELEIRINANLFGEARVIASTLVGSANRLLDGMKFGTLFIDEAAQALEAACWIPMRRVSRVVLAGDHCQLPPTVKSMAALKGGLGKTLMERIVENKPECVTLLNVQYRMNDEIMRFSSDWFYGGKVTTAQEITRRKSILNFDRPMLWLDTGQIDFGADEPGSKEQFIGENFGRIKQKRGHADPRQPASLLHEDRQAAHTRRADRRGRDITVSGTSAIPETTDHETRVFQALPQTDYRQHRGRFSRARARRNTHINGTRQREWGDRFLERPKTNERRHYASKNETHHTRRHGDVDTTSVL